MWKIRDSIYKPLYTAYKENPEQFEYLWNPEPYGDAIDTLYEG